MPCVSSRNKAVSRFFFLILQANKGKMKHIFGIFRIKKDERGMALAAALYAVVLNLLVILHYASLYTKVGEAYHQLFVRTFHISGFDPLSYAVVSQWEQAYNIYRHPLLAFFMLPAAQLNQALMAITGLNMAPFIVGGMLVFCAFYSILFLYRLMVQVIGVQRLDASLLSAFFMSMAYVMVSVSVPDHFCFSMFMLLLTLWVAGRKMQQGQPFTKWQTILFFIVTAGISLNNGIKIFMTNACVNGRKFWRPANLFLAIVLPSLLMWGAARMEWNHYERPSQYIKNQKRKAEVAAAHAKIAQAVRDTTHLTDTTAIKRAIQQAIKRQAHQQYVADHKQPWNRHKGQPMGKGEFTQWTDGTTSRWQSTVDNLMGESIQLHEDHLLQDTLRARPLFVSYRYALNYVVEGLVALLFLWGIWAGRHHRLLWLALSFWAFDMVIHMGLGFGLNEVYIMGAHWLFVIPIAYAYLLRQTATQRRWHRLLRTLLLVLTLFLFCWNFALYTHYLCTAA